MRPENEKSRPGHAGDGEVVRARVAVAREPVDLAPARIAEPEQARALVERLARRVVERRAEQLAARCASGRRGASCARRSRAGRGTAARAAPAGGRARRRGRRGGRRGRAAGGATRRRAFAAARPTSSAPISPGPRRHGDAVDVLERRARLGERLADHRRHELEVPPRRDLGHDAAVARVQLGLRGDDARADLAVVGDERRRGLVARRLDPEDQRATGSFHMISASSRLSV